ncbi:HAD-IA family hydrolase [Pirellulales bacterium]|nr:HAD-IA family hydrolase [Pirellulales bacterium]
MNSPVENNSPPPREPLVAVTFDLDGLMFNTEELYQESGNIILGRRGKKFTADLLDQMMGRPSHIALQLMIDYHQLTATPDQLAQETAEIFAELLPAKLAPMPGLLDLLSALEAASLPKGIATSSGRRFVGRVLEIAGFANRFEFVVASEDVVEGKPNPEPYLLAAHRHDVEPHRMLVLEDSQIGCAAAVASGAYAVAVPQGRSEAHQFPGAQFMAKSLADRRVYAVLGLA